MKQYLNYLLLLVMLAGVTGCEKDFVVDEQTAGKRMVVNCMFDNFRPFTVYVTESSTQTGYAPFHCLNDAVVELYQGSTYLETLTYIPSDSIASFGAFKSQTMAEPGKAYSVKVKQARYGEATASDYLPTVTPLVTAGLESYGNAANNFASVARIRFGDNVAADDYYRLNTWMSWDFWAVNEQGDSVLLQQGAALRPQPLNALSDTVRDNGWYLLFSDKGFNGMEKDLRFSFSGIPLEALEHVNIYIELHHVSEAHYRYFRTLEAYRASNPQSEPVTVFGNIINGYGIFCGEGISYAVLPVK